VGPRVLGSAKLPAFLMADQLSTIKNGAMIIDLSPSAEFAETHVPGTINIPLSMLAAWAGWLVDYEKPVYLIAESSQLPEAMRVLHKIGIDLVQGMFEKTNLKEAGLASESYVSESPIELAPRIEAGDVRLIDVRSDSEWNASHIPQAEHIFLGHLSDQLNQCEASKPVAVQCQSGARSAIAASIMQAAGYDVINLAGGFQAWKEAGLTTTATETVACGSASVTTCS
ncbi:MAG: MBL fold metallo-hydrolase, partial [Planctomycetaceae bacterium]|nr:MBL fold metallo-hydrolase [Planctomycetaceae bacterium]